MSDGMQLNLLYMLDSSVVHSSMRMLLHLTTRALNIFSYPLIYLHPFDRLEGAFELRSTVCIKTVLSMWYVFSWSMH